MDEGARGRDQGASRQGGVMETKLDEWIFYQDKNGDIKSTECNGHPIRAQELKATYSPVKKSAEISIVAYNFKVVPIKEE
jgi:hypothetical protein